MRKTIVNFVFIIFLTKLGSAQVVVENNLDLELAESDSRTSLKIEQSLNKFLTEAKNKDYSGDYVDSTHLRRFGFFFDKLAEIGKDSESYHNPLVLKSYPVENGSYRLTVAFTGAKDDQPFVFQITELKAVPYENHYRFHCPFQDNTSHFKSRTFENVTYYFSGSIDEKRAEEFVGFTKELAKLANGPIPVIDYYSFNSLDELLKSYGFLYSARQCNFLRHDLGFTDNDGKTYVTGTDDENYCFGFVPEYFLHNLPDRDEIYQPFAKGVATYYGGYSLSRDGMDKLKRQFREKLKQSPGVDFLQEFKKGRGSAISRHYSFYVMSAILFEEALKKKGFEEAIKLLYSGSEGERFFDNLNGVLGMDESEFHEAILRLIKE